MPPSFCTSLLAFLTFLHLRPIYGSHVAKPQPADLQSLISCTMFSFSIKPQSSPIVNYIIKPRRSATCVVYTELIQRSLEVLNLQPVSCRFIAIEVVRKQILMKCSSRARVEKVKNHMRLVEISIIIKERFLIAVYAPSVHYESTLDSIESLGSAHFSAAFDEVRNTFTTH